MKKILLKNIVNCSKTQIEEIRNIRNLEDVRKFMYSDKIIKKKEHLNHIKELKTKKNNIIFCIFDWKGKIAGAISLNSIDYVNKKSDWAFYIKPIYKGLGAIIEYYFINFFFDNLKFEKLNCEVIEFNTSTLKLHKKFFFDVEGIKKENIIKNGKRINVYYLGLTKKNWTNNKFKLKKFDKIFNNFIFKVIK